MGIPKTPNIALRLWLNNGHLKGVDEMIATDFFDNLDEVPVEVYHILFRRLV